MPSRLPQIFLNNSAVFQSPITRKKQGGIFELNLKDKQCDDLNSTFTAGFKEKHFKTCIYKKTLKDTETNYRTLPLRVSQYDVAKEKRLLTAHFSLFRSAKVKSFSLDKNPETCQTFHSCEEESNMNSLIASRRSQLSDLGFKMTPFVFVAEEYRNDLQGMKSRIEGEINEIEKVFTEGIGKLKGQITMLRKETGLETRKNKMEMEKYQEELRMFKEVAENFPEKIERIMPLLK